MPRKKYSKDEKKFFREMFWNSFILENSYNYERQQALGFALGMWPAIKRFYHNKKDQAKALSRHMEIFNTTPHLVPAITGVASALEKKASEDPDFQVDIINNIKVSLMGPLAGIGDSFFWGTLRVIATGIGTSLALQGNILGPILFLLIFNIPALLARYYGLFVGYNIGSSFIDKVQKTGLMDKLTYGASVLGLAVVGAMVASMVTIKIPLKIGSGAEATTVQKICDGIVPGILPLLFTFFVFWLDRKGWKSQYILLLIAAIGIFGAWSGILG